MMKIMVPVAALHCVRKLQLFLQTLVIYFLILHKLIFLMLLLCRAVSPNFACTKAKTCMARVYNCMHGYIEYKFLIIKNLKNAPLRQVFADLVTYNCTACIYICTTFTPQIKGKPVHIYHMLHWLKKLTRYTQCRYLVKAVLRYKQCLDISTALMRYLHCVICTAYISLTWDMAHLIVSPGIIRFLWCYTVILFSYIGDQAGCNCGIEFCPKDCDCGIKF